MLGASLQNARHWGITPDVLAPTHALTFKKVLFKDGVSTCIFASLDLHFRRRVHPKA
jgi:hypothetical protein